MIKILMIVLMFALIVVVHEWGHFIAARLFKVRVNEFAVGMGPKLWSKQKGETLYSIRALPIGGFCSMEGENGESQDEGSMLSKKPWQKLIIFAAGAVMNFILALILFTFIVGYQGVSSNKVLNVEPGFPASQAGLEAGDRIIAINDSKVSNFEEIVRAFDAPDKPYTFTVEKAKGNIEELVISPKIMEDGSARFGFGADKEAVGFLTMIKEGFSTTIMVIKQTFDGFISLITGKVKLDQLAGIVGVVQISSQVWNEGIQVSLMAAIVQMLSIAGILSANLGVFNLLPIPALDGGRMIFSFVEMIRRKPIDPEKEGMVHFVGIVLLMLLMVVVLYNDIVRVVG